MLLMIQEASWQGLAVRALILVPVALVAVRADVTKFRGWRERRRQWRAQGSTPPPEYQRDNDLWRWRITALGIALLAFVALLALTFGANPVTWLIWPVYGLAMIGAAAWNLLGAHVR